MSTYFDRVHETADFLVRRLSRVPDVAIVLGSGLGAFAESLADSTVLPYGDIPELAGIARGGACRQAGRPASPAIDECWRCRAVSTSMRDTTSAR
jgi:hypothetical protein